MSVAPKKSLGQHFLVDDNILGVIARLAELDTTTSSSRSVPASASSRAPGRALRSCPRRRDRPPARAAARGAGSAAERRRSYWATRSGSTSQGSGRLRRSSSPTSPTTSPRRSSPRASRAPSVGLWCVMVQREVADRFFAQPSTKAYGAVSVLVQLAASERRSTRSRARLPAPPNVDSALVAFRRRPLPADYRNQACRAGGIRASPQDAPELDRAGRRRDPGAGGRRAGRDRPRPGSPGGAAPSGAVRRAGSAPRMTARSLRPRSTSPSSSGRFATTASTRSRRCCKRSTSSTRSPSATPKLRVSGFEDDTLVGDALRELAAGARRAPAGT